MTDHSAYWQSTKALRTRQLKESLFRLTGIAAISGATLTLLALLCAIALRGSSAFLQTTFELDLFIDPTMIVLENERVDLNSSDFYTLLNKSLLEAFPATASRTERKEIKGFLSPAAEIELINFLTQNPNKIGHQISIILPTASLIDQIHKQQINPSLDPEARGVSDFTLGLYTQAVQSSKIATRFNWDFFTRGDSRNPAEAGIGGAIVGSFFTLLICLSISLPLGMAAAVYLEEFAQQNWLNYLINININNLAAVPSIIYGLLGLSIFLNLLELPRGTPIVGGLVLALMTLPIIIITSRSALAAVPPSIKSAALALGASRMQVILHHVLPLAVPGTMTGAIVGLARALGETAPLLMIGMVAFVVDIPSTPLSAATVLPVQIYLWAESAERGFIEKTSAAIMVTLVFLIMMNFFAVIVRNRYEKRW